MKLVDIYFVALNITQIKKIEPINILEMDPRDFNIPFFGIDNSNNYITSSCRCKQKYGYSFDIKKKYKKLF